MAKFQGGFSEIIKAIQLMNPDERKRIVSDISKHDPKMAEAIENSLYSLEDLVDVTPKMLVSFLSKIDIDDLAIALRACSEDLQKFLVKNISSRNSKTIMEVLEGPKVRKEVVLESHFRVMKVFKNMVEKEELIFSKDDILV